ncbi:MAG: hypothetical protein FWG53_03220 [Clostridiales bacterium]|nr:hypothetical protein [Clostridiales bacterium]
MDKKNYKAPIAKKLLSYLVLAAVFLLVLRFVTVGLTQAGETSSSEGLRIAEDSIRRAVVNCYASEGNYPPSYEYLKSHYGISVDESKYIVHYEIFASNIMPDITVLEVKR